MVNGVKSKDFADRIPYKSPNGITLADGLAAIFNSFFHTTRVQPVVQFHTAPSHDVQARWTLSNEKKLMAYEVNPSLL